MRVVFKPHPTRSSTIVDSPDVEELIAWAMRDKRNIAFLVSTIQRYSSQRVAAAGAPGRASLRDFGRRFFRKDHRREGIDLILAVLSNHADRNDLSNVKGALVEAMAYYSLRRSYPPDTVRHNQHVLLYENDGAPAREVRSIDVAAHVEGDARSQYLYCKYQARYFEHKSIAEMVNELSGHASRLVVMCADDGRVARSTLPSSLDDLLHRLTLLPWDQWWDGLPVDGA